MEEDKPNAVGYKCPPKDRRFRRGQSGNLNGRPKGVRNFKTDLREELSESISIREGGRDISISKQRALIKRLVASDRRRCTLYCNADVVLRSRIRQRR